MTDKTEMWDDISRELARTAPAPAKSAVPSNMHVFAVDVVFSSVFKPVDRQDIYAPNRRVEDFALTFKMKDLPVGLTSYVQPRISRDGKDEIPVATVHTKFAPVVVARRESGCSLDTTIRCARESNIEPDRLLRAARVEIAVEAVEFESHFPRIPASRYSPGGQRRMVRRLELRAIRVNVDTMVDTYDQIMSELNDKFDGEGF